MTSKAEGLANGVFHGMPQNKGAASLNEALLQKSLVGSDQKYLNKRYFGFA